MDPTDVSYRNNRSFIQGMRQELQFNCDDSVNEGDYCESSEIQDVYYIEEFDTLKDVTRSKKFYLKKRDLDQVKLNELEDVFMERTAEEETDSEEEKIIQVVWSEEDPIQSKLVKFVESLEIKKSNSKFTLSMLDEERGDPEIDYCEGEEIKGRFLEVKDSLEVIATSSRNLHGSKYSDWDFSVEQDHELMAVNRIWRKSDSPWTSSLQIEIGKLPSQADQETVLQVLDDGAQGIISVRDVTQCLGNLLEKVNPERDGSPNKKVSFNAVPSKSCLSKESLSQTSTHSTRSSSQKKVSFYTEFNDEEDEYDDITDKSKKVSFYELAYDDDVELIIPSESGKIKKSVSFHDSVDFEKAMKIKANDSGMNIDLDSASSERSSYSENNPDCNNRQVYVIGKWNINDGVTSRFSLAESFTTFSTQTSLDDGEAAESPDLSDSSLHSFNRSEDRNMPHHTIEYLEDQLNHLSLHDSMVTETVGIHPKNFGSPLDCTNIIDQCYKTVLHDTKIDEDVLEEIPESQDEKIKFIRSLIIDSLDKKIEESSAPKVSKNETCREEDEALISGLSKSFKLFYEHCREIIDIDSLSKNMGLAMAFEERNPNYNGVNADDTYSNPTEVNLADRIIEFSELYKEEVTALESKIREFKVMSNEIDSNKHNVDTITNEDEYLSADSDVEVKTSTSNTETYQPLHLATDEASVSQITDGLPNPTNPQESTNFEN